MISGHAQCLCLMLQLKKCIAFSSLPCIRSQDCKIIFVVLFEFSQLDTLFIYAENLSISVLLRDAVVLVGALR